ncbi:MAG: hypothetical protein Unbinned6316contig1000_8 [Prokaryotic dsDNA virus sp.]|nr:MAG: hypothetical protein Unbinned6316contig1000_8 [Prokaryotic dsDNA virus sp.]|tara:strand:- start:7090 stop:7650 length:561 start_codon:yes stop_codon:yes gene_type:complete
MAVKNKTYNNVVDTLCRVAQNHLQVSSISVGDIYDINLAKMEKFPLVHINPVNVETGQSSLTYNFQIFIMDMVSEKNDWPTRQQEANLKRIDNKSNEQQVFNQTLQIATDIIGVFRHSSRLSQHGELSIVGDINAPLYFTEGEYTLEPFLERFDNLCCGWVFNIGVLTKNNFDTCDIPMGDFALGS